MENSVSTVRIKQNCYVDYVLVTSQVLRWIAYFQRADSENRAICVPGVGSTKPFSALVTNRQNAGSFS